MAALPPFPNYTQIPSRLPISVWQLLRVCSLIGALVVVLLLVAVPDTGLFVMWKVVIPLLPLLFMTAPGLWRNLCPLAASNQMPRWLGITKGLTAPKWLREYGYVDRVQPVHRLRRAAQARDGRLAARGARCC